MKEFNKWWNKNKYVFISTDDRIVAESVWKAALEWVMKGCEKKNDDFCLD